MRMKLIICILISAFLTQVASAQINTSSIFMRIPISARANGMGGASVNLVDEESAISNPGALGLFHLNHAISFSVPDNTPWLPKLTDEISLDAFSFSAGIPTLLSRTNSARPFKLAIGGAFSRIRLNLGTFTGMDSFGNVIGPVIELEDRVESFSLGIGAQFLLRLGIGFTYQDIQSDVLSFVGPSLVRVGKAKANAGRLGIIIEAPFSTLFSSGNKKLSQGKRPPWDLTLSLANVRNLFSDDLNFAPLTEVERTGISLYGALNGDHLSQISLRLVYERDSDGADSSSATIKRYGAEVGVFDIAYLRGGKIDDPGFSQDITTYGFGLRLRGLLALLFSDTPTSETFSGSILTRKLDVRFDFSHYKDETNLAVGDTDFFKLSVTL